MRSRLPINFKIIEKLSFFLVEETLKTIKPSIIDITEEFQKDASTIDRLMSRWRTIVHIKWTCTTFTLEFWNEVMDYKDAAGNNPFADLSQLAISLLSRPHSYAEIERLFSQMNIVKTKLRNHLSVKTSIQNKNQIRPKEDTEMQFRITSLTAFYRHQGNI